MTTAEKLVKIAENEIKVFEAGQKSVLDESKIIEKTVSGSVISLDDVSEIPHNIEVQLSNVNAFPYPYYDATSKTTNGITFTDNGDRTITISGKATADAYFYLSVIDFGNTNMWNNTEANGYKVIDCQHFFYNGNNKIASIVVTAGTDYSSNPITVNPKIVRTSNDFSGVKVTVLNGKNLFNPEVLLNYGGVFQEDGSIFFKTTNVMSDVVVYQNDGNTQRFSLSYLVRCVDNTASSGVRFKAFYTDGSYNYIGNVKPLDYEMVTWVSDSGKVLDCIKGDYGSTLNSTWLKDIQLEIGTSPTEYEKYTAYDYIAESNGKIIAKSSSPYMKITTDTLGINLTSTYHKSWGMQTEYDRFWDAFQKNGTALVNGTYMFSGHGWTDNIYAPKYPIKLNVGTGLFAYSDITDTKVEIDFTNTSGSDTHVFYWAQYVTNIRKLKVSENTTYSNWFNYCSYLKEIRFEGTISKSLDIHWSTKLSAESYSNIIAYLSLTATGVTLTVPSVAPSVYDEKYGAGTWDFSVSVHPNWTFAYA